MKNLQISLTALAPASTFAASTLGNTTVTITAISFSAGVATYTFSLATGSLGSIAVGATIVITGLTNPGNNGTFVITSFGATTFAVSNASGVANTGQSGTGTITVNVRSMLSSGIEELFGTFSSDTSTQAPLWGTWSFGTAYLNQPYSYSWDIENVATPVTYSVFSGTLPTGLTLNNIAGAEGSITGTPTVLGIYSFTLRATNIYGNVDQAFSITVSAASGGGGTFVFIS